MWEPSKLTPTGLCVCFLLCVRHKTGGARHRRYWIRRSSMWEPSKLTPTGLCGCFLLCVRHKTGGAHHRRYWIRRSSMWEPSLLAKAVSQPLKM